VLAGCAPGGGLLDRFCSSCQSRKSTLRKSFYLVFVETASPCLTRKLARKHDSSHTRRLFRFARVFRTAGHVVDLREERLAGDFEAAEVVLAKRVVVLVEVREVLELDRVTKGLGNRGNPVHQAQISP